MDLYDELSQRMSRELTIRYSTSFGTASRLFSSSIRQDIYNIYGFVRLADEIVDTYRGSDAGSLLDRLENDTYHACSAKYSTNPILHAFQITANKYSIDKTLIEPFIRSMRTDLTTKTFTEQSYASYIYGSAEVIGLMCLKIFTQNNINQYNSLRAGAQHLGAAYQKVNFLRDFAADYHQLGRVYFPGVRYDAFDDTQKAIIITDIRADFAQALSAINRLPKNSQKAVELSYNYYQALLNKLEQTPASYIKQHRIRVPNSKKLVLFAQSYVRTHA